MVPNVALVVEIPTVIFEVVAEPPGLKRITPLTSQSPAVSETLVAFTPVALVAEVPLVLLLKNSPTLPAFALLLVVVPTIPFVCEGVKLPVLLRTVNAPVEGVVAPTDALLIVPPEMVDVLIVAVPKVGLVPNTNEPDPVSSEITPAS